MANPLVGLHELAAWITRCESGDPDLREVGDADLKDHYTVMLIVRMLVFSHQPGAEAERDPLVDSLVERLGPCLDAAYREADRRGWEPNQLREAARQVLSPSSGDPIDAVAIFRAG